MKLIREIQVASRPEIIWNMIVKHLEHPEIEGERDSEWKRLAIKDLRGEALTPNRRGVGVRTRWQYSFYGFPFNWDDEVTEWVEPKRIAWTSISTWKMDDSFTVMAADSESRLVYEMDYVPPYGILGRIHFSLLVHRQLEKHIEYVLRRMKRNAEELARLRA